MVPKFHHKKVLLPDRLQCHVGSCLLKNDFSSHDLDLNPC